LSLLRETYLSSGSNQGDRLDFLHQAVDLIAERIGMISHISPVYKTESYGFKADDFLNIAIRVQTKHNPEFLIHELLEIENFIGRTRVKSDAFESRIIDIDIILFEDEIIFTPDCPLVILHC